MSLGCVFSVLMSYSVLLLLCCCVVRVVFFFFFKQKTAYEMLRSLVGSEMCIRDSPWPVPPGRSCEGRSRPDSRPGKKTT